MSSELTNELAPAQCAPAEKASAETRYAWLLASISALVDDRVGSIQRKEGRPS